MSDIEDMVESERLQEIYTMKQQVYETKDEVDRAVARGRIDRGTAIGLYQRKVRDYVMAVETLLDPADGDASEHWEDRRVGDFVLPDGRHINVNGLDEFLELSTTFSVDVEREQQRSYRHKSEQVTETVAARPPQQLIERAFRMTNKALDAAGFGLEEPTERQQSGFDRIDDVDKGGRILDFLRELDDGGLREVQLIIERDLLAKGDSDPDSELTNGSHE